LIFLAEKSLVDFKALPSPVVFKPFVLEDVSWVARRSDQIVYESYQSWTQTAFSEKTHFQFFNADDLQIQQKSNKERNPQISLVIVYLPGQLSPFMFPRVTDNNEFSLLI